MGLLGSLANICPACGSDVFREGAWLDGVDDSETAGLVCCSCHGTANAQRFWRAAWTAGGLRWLPAPPPLADAVQQPAAAHSTPAVDPWGYLRVDPEPGRWVILVSVERDWRMAFRAQWERLGCDWWVDQSHRTRDLPRGSWRKLDQPYLAWHVQRLKSITDPAAAEFAWIALDECVVAAVKLGVLGEWALYRDYWPQAPPTGYVGPLICTAIADIDWRKSAEPKLRGGLAEIAVRQKPVAKTAPAKTPAEESKSRGGVVPVANHLSLFEGILA